MVLYCPSKSNLSLSQADIKFAQQVFDYIQNKETFIDDIKLLSTIEHIDLVNIKEMYEILLTFSKEKWIHLIANAEERHVFDTLELDNIKSIQTALIKKERIKEQSLIKAYQSLQKLQVFEDSSVL